jgi:exopolysaccharide biosynthesis protein
MMCMFYRLCRSAGLACCLLGLLQGCSRSVDVDPEIYERRRLNCSTTAHILRIDPALYRVRGLRSGHRSGREEVREMAHAVGAFAAVNGGFWKESGDPAGVLKVDGALLAANARSRGAIGWSSAEGPVLFDRLASSSSTGEIGLVPLLEPEKAGMWRDCAHIVGGVPLLIHAGVPIHDYSPEHARTAFLSSRYPRTAVGRNAVGEWLFVVVDGSCCGLVGGLSIPELAALMQGLGCVEALNLDGGGSSTLYIEGQVRNRPAGRLHLCKRRGERVSDAILIERRSK